MVEVNLLGTFQVTQVFGERMAAHGGGSIINIGSLYASVSPDANFYAHLTGNAPFIKSPAYGASKAAVVNMTKFFATHWAGRGIRVNTLSPGGVLAGQDEQFKSKYGARVPLARMAEPEDLKGPLDFLNTAPGPIDLRVHALYNPENNTQYNIVPGLMGVILTMTMIMITGLAITRERERGTMENLLSMPTRPSEVLIGKIVPYVLIGYIQVGVILVASHFLFHVPMHGSILLLLAVALVFIAANLAMGITFSTVAKNQLQAMQMTFFVFLPSILLSGFMFPFRGMPRWAQVIGEVFPLTHFLRIVRGILLKGNGISDVVLELWPILLFAAIMLTIGIKRYRQTLD